MLRLLPSLPPIRPSSSSVDFNQPLIKNTLALRFAAVKSRQDSWRKPAGSDDDRYYGTVTLKPLKWTTLRAYYEDSMLDMTTPRNVRFGDQVTPWINAGRPAFNNGLTNYTTLTAANSGLFARNTSAKPIFMVGASAPGTSYTIWGSAAAVNIALATTRYGTVTIGPGDAPYQSGVDSYIYSLPYNESISPFDVSVNGNGTRNLMYGKVWSLSLEQWLPGEIFFQVNHNREHIRNPICDFRRGISSAVKADANLFLPDRVTPNPNSGRYYVEGDPRGFGFRSDTEETRVMLSREFDFTKRTSWTRWFGRHRAAAMYLRSESCNQQQSFDPRVIPPGLSPATFLDNLGGSTYNTLRIRAYLSDPTDLSSMFRPTGPPTRKAIRKRWAPCSTFCRGFPFSTINRALGIRPPASLTPTTAHRSPAPPARAKTTGSGCASSTTRFRSGSTNTKTPPAPPASRVTATRSSPLSKTSRKRSSIARRTARPMCRARNSTTPSRAPIHSAG